MGACKKRRERGWIAIDDAPVLITGESSSETVIREQR
jgi:hypothetical protein